MKYEAVDSHYGSAGSRMLRGLVSRFNVSFPSKVGPDEDALERFRGERNRQFTGDEVFFYDPSMKSAEVWSGLAEWIRALDAVATLNPEEMKNNPSRKGGVQAAVVDGGCDVPEVPVLPEQCTTPRGIARRAPRRFQAGGKRVGAHIQAEA